MIASSLIDYWSRLGPSERLHPEDRDVWQLLRPGFDDACLPTPFYGRIIDAPIVLLFLSPGLNEQDPIKADDPTVQDRCVGIRKGSKPLCSREEWPDLWDWWAPRAKVFGDPNDLRERIAIMNISAYKSAVFGDYPAFAALPSCRFNLDWARRVLFRQAEIGERVVVCLRGARYWGLETGRAYDGTLFAPPVNRAGHMLAGDGSSRGQITEAVRRALSGSCGRGGDAH